MVTKIPHFTKFHIKHRHSRTRENV